MLKSLNGFTIVELLVVIVVIGVLTNISALGFNRYQASTRDSQRSSKASTLAEALEKYYDNNGEYPGCLAASGAAATVTSSVLPGLDPNTLITPSAAGGVTNSIVCTDLTGAPGEIDSFAYVGDGSAACSSGQSCLNFTLKYKNESSGTIKSITSRRQTKIATSGGSVLTSSVNFTQINLSWTAVNNALNYTLQQATNSGFTANLIPSTVTSTTAMATSITPGVTYYFRVMPNASGSVGNWSNVISTATWTNPTAPVIAVTLSGANILATINPVTCPASTTAQYEIRSRTNGGSWGSYSAWSSTSTASQAAAQGVKYGYQAQVQCYSVPVTSATFTGVEYTYTDPILAPVAPTVAAVTSGADTTYSWSDAGCPSGTTTQYSYDYTDDSPWTDGWTSPDTYLSDWYDTSMEGYQYTVAVQAQCYNSNATSPFSTSGSASYIRPVQMPPAATFSLIKIDGHTVSVNSTSSCTNGALLYSRGDIWIGPTLIWTSSGATGWWATSHTVSTPVMYVTAWNWYGWTLTVPIYEPSENFVSGSKFAIETDVKCVNSTTLRASAARGIVNSGAMTLP